MNNKGSSMLPKHFHYDGMHKIKAGKGYHNQITGEQQVLGVEGGPCPECNKITYLGKSVMQGTIISIKICTNVKGFETTTEKVCDTCGMVYPTSFQILDKVEEDYRTMPYPTHEIWKKNNSNKQLIPDDIDSHMEYRAQIIGARPKETPPVAKPTEINNSTIRLFKAFGRLSNTPATIKQPMKEWRGFEYHKIADDYIHELQLNKADAADVHWIVDHRKYMFKMDYKVEDIIECICVYIKRKSYKNHRKGNVYYARYCIENPNIKTLYSLIVQKMNS